MNELSCHEYVPKHVSVKSCLWWHQLCSCCHRFNCGCWYGLFTEHHATDTPCRTPSTIAPRPRIWRVLQLIRARAHLLVQHMIPRAHLQLLKFLLVSNSRCLCRTARARSQSFPCHTITFILYTARIHCIGECNADVYNHQTNHTNPPHAIHDVSYGTCNCDHCVRRQQLPETCARAIG